MAKLSDTQLVILSTACQRDDRLALPLPNRLKGGAAAKVITSLIAKGLIKEIRAKLDQPVWCETDDKRLTLVATDAAFETLGIAPDDAPAGTDSAPDIVVDPQVRLCSLWTCAWAEMQPLEDRY
jgi:hypothetical protein